MWPVRSVLVMADGSGVERGTSRFKSYLGSGIDSFWSVAWEGASEGLESVKDDSQDGFSR